VKSEESNDNPIEKKMLIITGGDGQLCINELDNLPPEQQQQQEGQQRQQRQQQQQGAGQQQFAAQQQPGVQNMNNLNTREVLYTMLNQLNNLQQALASLQAVVQTARVEEHQFNAGHFDNIHRNVRRIGAQPIRQLQRAAAAAQNNNAGGAGGGGGGAAGGGGGAAGGDGGGGGNFGGGGLAELSATPRSLDLLWEEYLNGVGGRKAARHFTPQERGKNKYKYCRRLIVWNLISMHVNAGITSQRSCEMIYAHYGQQNSVTTIINNLRRDIRSPTGLPVALRVGRVGH
jgi:hypothetical protein